MRTLLLIDLQIDFCRGGALEVPDGDSVIAVANGLMPEFDLVIGTQDWHPANHKSFAANHLWRKPGQVIDLNGLKQVLWPIHCVADSFGAEFHPDLNLAGIHHVVRKGVDPEYDSYSAFFDNGKQRGTGLHEHLQQKGIRELHVMGLATNYCVLYTVHDAIQLGYQVTVITNGCRGIDMQDNDSTDALIAMHKAGARLIGSDQLVFPESVRSFR